MHTWLHTWFAYNNRTGKAIDKARYNGIANWEHENRCIHPIGIIDFEKANYTTLGFCNLPLPSPAPARAVLFRVNRRAGGFRWWSSFYAGRRKADKWDIRSSISVFRSELATRSDHPGESPYPRVSILSKLFRDSRSRLRTVVAQIVSHQFIFFWFLRLSHDNYIWHIET